MTGLPSLERALDDERLNDFTYRFLVRISRHLRDGRNPQEVKLAAIAHAARCSRTTAKRALDQLVTCGYLGRERGARQTDPARYHLLFHLRPEQTFGKTTGRRVISSGIDL